MDYNYSKEQLLDMYYNLKRGRIFTLKMHDAVGRGLIRSSFHTPYGQEAIGVAVASAARKTDWISFTHRMQTAMIMRFDLKQFIAELFGFKAGMRNGTAFDYHISDYDEDGVRVGFSIGTLGGVIPMQTGMAWALQRQGKDEVVIVTHGDGGCSEGAAYEGWQIGALLKVPVVYVIENNEWAMTVPLERESANPNISEKAAACGMPYTIVDGNDILASRKAMDDAIEMARNGQPNIVELKTLRWEAHFKGQGNDYRHDTDKIKYSMENDDCVKNYEAYLLDKGLIDAEYIEKLSAEIEAEIDEALEAAACSGKATYDEVYCKEFVYATPETGGDL